MGSLTTRHRRGLIARTHGRRLGSTLGLALLGSVAVAEPALSQDIPKRKAGLWEQTVTGPDLPSATRFRQCVDAATDDLLRQEAEKDRDVQCQTREVSKIATGWSFRQSCTDRSKRSFTAVGSVTGDLVTSYQMDMTLTFNPPVDGRKSMRMKTEGRFVGACPSGMKPGTVQMQGMPAVPPGAMQGVTPEQQKQIQKMLETMQQQQSGSPPAQPK